MSATPATGEPADLLAPQSRQDLLDDRVLADLGYKRRFHRKLTAFDSAASPFVVISIITGIASGFALGMNDGGPRTLVWGWILVSIMTLVVGLAMMEICATMPTSGALYYWTSRLAPPKVAVKRSWTTAHLNLIGLVAGTSAVGYVAAVYIGGLTSVLWNWAPTQRETFGIFVLVQLLFAVLNSLPVTVVTILNRISVIWLIGGVVLLVTVLYAAGGKNQPASFIFAHWVNNTGFSFAWYGCLIGVLMSGFTYCGFDAAAHLSEDTKDAGNSAPKGIVRSIMWSGPAGLVLIIALVSHIRNYSGEAGATVPPAQIFLDSVGRWGEILMLVVAIGAMLMCGAAGSQANSRMSYSVSRDRILPGWRQWSQVSQRTSTPIKAVWFTSALSFVLGIPALFSSVVFNAVASINVIGVFTAYAIPIWYRYRAGASFAPGSLGRFGRPVALVAVIWVFLLDVLLVLPESNPVWKASTFNFAPVVFIVVLIISTVWWLLSGRSSYSGPVRTISEEEAATLHSEVI